MTQEVFVDMTQSRRRFLQTAGATGVAAAIGKSGSATQHPGAKGNFRRFHTVQIDVFTSQRLQGNPLSVFTDARGLNDSEMQDLARETNLQETTFVFPRDSRKEERKRKCALTSTGLLMEGLGRRIRLTLSTTTAARSD
jgi:hypothetical protein